jgi:hypothetical protein
MTGENVGWRGVRVCHRCSSGWRWTLDRQVDLVSSAVAISIDTEQASCTYRHTSTDGLRSCDMYGG